MKHLLRSWLLMVVLLLPPRLSFGWLEFAHCVLGELTGTGPGYNTVPDFWPSYDDLLGIPDVPYILDSGDPKGQPL